MQINTVRVSYFPQDPKASPPGEMALSQSEVGDRLEGPRLRMDDGEPARPDAQGNFLFQPGTREFQQANSLACATRTLRLFEEALGHEIPWAFRGKLNIHPHYGEGFNAFYLRQDHSINFFDGFDPKVNKTVASSESLDVVSHETGHAVLDALKPGLVGWFGSEQAAAFHESFGDLATILTALHDESVLARLVEDTGGDLRRPNQVARLAEEVSAGINHVHLGGTRPEDWAMRDANNDFSYVDPSRLPERAAPEELSREPHSFGRIFTGACWELMARMTEDNMRQGQDARQAIVTARDSLLNLCAHGVELGPNRLKRLGQMARSMVTADQRYLGGRHAALLDEVMTRRGLLSPAAEETLPELRLERVPTTAGEAEAVLERLGPLPPLTCESIVENREGETFLRYLEVREVELDAGTSTDLAASLTLGFDREGRLFHRLWEPIDGESVELAREEARVRLSQGAIRTEDTHELLNASEEPYAGYLVGTAGGHQKLVRIPAA